MDISLILLIIFWVVCGAIAGPIAVKQFEKKYKTDGTDEYFAAFLLGPVALIMVLSAWIVDKYYK